MGGAGQGRAVRRADQLRRQLADGRQRRRHPPGPAAARRCRQWRAAALADLSSARRSRSALAAAIAIASASDPWFAAIGLAAIAVLCGLFALHRRSPSAGSRAARSICGGPITRLGIAALDRPGAATGRLAVSLGLGLTLAGHAGRHGIEHPCRDRHIGSEAGPGPVPGRYPASRGVAASARSPRRELPGRRAAPGPFAARAGDRGQWRSCRPTCSDIPEGAWILRGDRGLTFARELPPANRIVAGQWWPKDYRGPPLVSIDVDAATALNLKVGDTLTVAILGRPIEARIASFREIDWRSLGFNFAIIFAPGALEAAPYTLMATVAPADGGIDRRASSGG